MPRRAQILLDGSIGTLKWEYCAMMNTMAAFCITALFSVWVWSLKNELAEMQRRMSPAPHLPHRSVDEDVRSVRPASPGLPTWTIE